MKAPRGKDGDHLDVFIGDHPESRNVYVVNQRKLEGGFDEVKIMLGFEDEESAIACYDKGFMGDLGPKLRDSVVATTVDGLKRWIKDGDTKKAFEQLKENLAKAQPTAQGIMARAKSKSDRLKAKGWTKKDFADVFVGGPAKQKEVGLRVRQRQQSESFDPHAPLCEMAESPKGILRQASVAHTKWFIERTLDAYGGFLRHPHYAVIRPQAYAWTTSLQMATPFLSSDDAQKMIEKTWEESEINEYGIVVRSKPRLQEMAESPRKALKANALKAFKKKKLRCRYSDCKEQHPLAKEDEAITCPTCRKYLELPPLPEGRLPEAESPKEAMRHFHGVDPKDQYMVQNMENCIDELAGWPQAYEREVVPVFKQAIEMIKKWRIAPEDTRRAFLRRAKYEAIPPLRSAGMEMQADDLLDVVRKLGKRWNMDESRQPFDQLAFPIDASQLAAKLLELNKPAREILV